MISIVSKELDDNGIINLHDVIVSIEVTRNVSVYPVLNGEGVSIHISDHGFSYSSKTLTINIPNLTSSISTQIFYFIENISTVLVHTHLGSYECLINKHSESGNTCTLTLSIINRVDSVSI